MGRVVGFLIPFINVEGTGAKLTAGFLLVTLVAVTAAVSSWVIFIMVVAAFFALVVSLPNEHWFVRRINGAPFEATSPEVREVDDEAVETGAVSQPQPAPAYTPVVDPI